MNAEIITIGDEILIGQIVDTNATFIAKELNKIGVSVVQITSTQDKKEAIISSLESAKSRADIVILTGGLGPTKDDITKHTFCQYFKDTLVKNQMVLDHISQLLRHLKVTLKEVHKKQALIPSRAKVLFNTLGTAPGMWMHKENTVFISLPGVPHEMKKIIADVVIPEIQSNFDLPYIQHNTYVVYRIGESDLAEKIAPWEEQLQPPLKLAYLPNYNSVRLRISGVMKDQSTLMKLMKEASEELKNWLKGLCWEEEGVGNLEQQLKELCVAKKITLATAESITGGGIAEKITSVAGASQYFKGGMVCYATSSKISILGVEKKLIQKHSVVSDAVAEAMAKQIKNKFQTDFAIATTGNAGPAKGDSDEDIGNVFFAIATPRETYSYKYRLGKGRAKIINKAIFKALELAIEKISNF